MYMIDNFVDNSQKKRLGEYFKQIDTDNDGKLSKDELIQGILPYIIIIRGYEG